MNARKRTIRAMALLLLLFAVGCILCVMPTNHFFPLRDISSFYFISLGVVLFLYFKHTVIEQRVRRYLIIVAALIVFWFFLRIEKYLAFEESESIVRHLWYLYYVPTLLIPQFSFMAALAVGRPAEERLPWAHYLTGAIAVAFTVLVLTNDIHQLVFGFKPGFVDSNSDYTHKPLYWAIAVWDYLFLFFTVAALLHTCSVPASRRLYWIPVVYVTMFALWMIATAFDMRPTIGGENFGEFPESACFAMGGFWVLCICAGLVPSNTGYKKFFAVTHLAALIADADYRIAYRSPSAKHMSTQQLAADTPFMLDNDTCVYRRPVTGGYAYWQVDVSELNRVNTALANTREALAEEAELRRQENDLRKTREQIDARSKIYDDIAHKVRAQSLEIGRIASATIGSVNAAAFDGGSGSAGDGGNGSGGSSSSGSSSSSSSSSSSDSSSSNGGGIIDTVGATGAFDDGDTADSIDATGKTPTVHTDARFPQIDESIRLISIYAVYIKRLSNLMLLAATSDLIDRTELQLAIQESFRYLNHAGYITDCAADDYDAPIDATVAIEAYDLFETVLERTLPHLRAVSAVFSGAIVKLTLECAQPTVALSAQALQSSGKIHAHFEVDDRETYVRIDLAQSVVDSVVDYGVDYGVGCTFDSKPGVIANGIKPETENSTCENSACERRIPLKGKQEGISS